MIPALVDHLWQSTLFVLAAGALSLGLRRSGAALRYGVWLAASVKFLIPFAALMAIGEAASARLHPLLPPPHVLPSLAPLIEPRSLAVMGEVAGVAATPPIALPVRAAPVDLAPVLLGAWALGLGAVLLIWAARWRRLRAALKAASPMALAAPVPALSSPLLLEPGVVGLRRPVLLLPEGIAERLSPAELDAVIAHELCHIRRGDNLTGALHMLVQALFWFHPLAWWIGDRLVAERELACDEAVIRAGHERETYARSILETCRHYLRSPLTCVAGVSGADLRRRVETIMTAPLSSPLPRAAKALFGAAAVLALASPVAAGMIAGSKALQPAAPPPAGTRIAAAAPAEPVLVAKPGAPQPSAPKPAAQASAAGSPAAASSPAGEVARLRAEQERPRQVVPFDPARFDRYVGYYELAPNAVLQMTRVGDRFYSQLTGQGPVQVFPESDVKFFATVVAAQISFDLDAQGRATGLVLHQNGREQRAPKIDAAAAASLTEALEQRLASNAPSPGTAAFLKRYLDSEEAGAPDYNGMTERLAAAVRAQNDPLTRAVKAWGPLQSIRFSGITPQGLDRYAVTFSNAVVPAVVGPLDADGKVDALLFTPPSAGPAMSAEVARRMKANQPSPGTEAAVRKWLASAAAGQQDYDGMAPALAQIARQQWPRTRQQFEAFGPLETVRFVRVSAQGQDVYEAEFQNNRVEVAITPPDADGKVERMSWRVIP